MVLGGQGPADVVVGIVAPAFYPAVDSVETLLGFPAAPAAWCTAGWCPLPGLQATLCTAVALAVLVRYSAAIHGQGTDAHVHPAHRLSFSLGRCYVRFPVGNAGIPGAILSLDGCFVGYAFRQ